MLTTEKLLSILIIDDDNENLTLFSKILKRAIINADILTATNGSDGLKLAKKHLPDTIILDIIMPDMDGYSVCKILKEDTKTKDIPIIIITGIEEKLETKIKVLKLGAEAFLTKPIHNAELTAQIQSMLRIKIAEDKIKDEKNRLEKIVEQRTGDLKQELKERKKIENELKETQKQLRLHSAHNINLQEQERIRISRGLHDEMGQVLTGLQMRLSAFSDHLKEENQSCSGKNKSIKMVNELYDMTDYIFGSVKRIIYDLRPPVLDHLGLIAAIEWLAKDFLKKTEIEIIINNLLTREPKFSNEQSTAIFRIFQESLTNITRHSKATKVSIQLKAITKKKIEFKISDNGNGFDDKKINRSKGFGLMGMRERAAQFNWNIIIKGQKGEGTIITLKTE